MLLSIPTSWCGDHAVLNLVLNNPLYFSINL
jgi:hypothetical protein